MTIAEMKNVLRRPSSFLRSNNIHTIMASKTRSGPFFPPPTLPTCSYPLFASITRLCLMSAVFCFPQLAASDSGNQYQQPAQEQQQQELQKPLQETATEAAAADVSSTTASSSFKDKLKGIVSSVKEGAVDTYESVSESVSGAAHSFDEKRKEVVAGTKKLVNTAIGKIKNKYDSFKSGEKDVSTQDPNSSEESIDQRVQTDDNSKKH